MVPNKQGYKKKMCFKEREREREERVRERRQACIEQDGCSFYQNCPIVLKEKSHAQYAEAFKTAYNILHIQFKSDGRLENMLWYILIFLSTTISLRLSNVRFSFIHNQRKHGIKCNVCYFLCSYIDTKNFLCREHSSSKVTFLISKVIRP